LFYEWVFRVVLVDAIHGHFGGLDEEGVAGVERSEVVEVTVEFFWGVLGM